MPGDGSWLWVADLRADGTVGPPNLVAGGLIDPAAAAVQELTTPPATCDAVAAIADRHAVPLGVPRRTALDHVRQILES